MQKILSILVVLLFSALAQAETTYGPFYAGTAQNAAYGGNAWADVSSATGAPDGDKASVQIAGREGETDRLRLSNFGANVPSGATVVRVRFVFTRSVFGWNDSEKQILIGGVEFGECSQAGDQFTFEGAISPATVNAATTGFSSVLYSSGAPLATVDSCAMFVDVE